MTDTYTLILVDRIKTGQLLIEQNPEWVFISGEMKAQNVKKIMMKLVKQKVK